MTDRPPISNPLKRKVRQHCAFGCVICGAPFFDYDHISDYSIVTNHTFENIALLCKRHHDDKTDGRLSARTVRLARANPFNSGKENCSKYRIHPNSGAFRIKLGNNLFVNEIPELLKGMKVPVLVVGRRNVVSILYNKLEEDIVSLPDVEIFDESGRNVVSIVDGEFQYGLSQWDVETVGSSIKIRRGPRDILLDMDIKANALEIRKADIWFDTLRVKIDETGVVDPQGNFVSNYTSYGGFGGVSIDHHGFSVG